MAIWFAEENMQGRQALIYADEQSDMGADLVKFGEDNHLKKGAKCFCLATREVKFLNSKGQWV